MDRRADNSVSLRRRTVVVIRIVRLLAIVTAAWWSFAVIADTRGVKRPAKEGAADAIETFDPKQSAALFVGVCRFPYDSTVADVRYAVDDAIDLAFVFALDDRVRLVDPARVILALSGDPQKPESRQNLDRLVAAGAKVRSAGQADIITALQEQANSAGRTGVLVIAFATHGISYDGTQHLLTATSVLPHRETTISESKIRDLASRSDATRSLILVDACRERLVDDRRNSEPDRRSAASLIHAMSGAQGQVVLSAAAAGQYAYDDDVRRNGVFTAAVIDGLGCDAPMDARGLVTVDTLSAFVEDRVLTWIRKQRSISIARATQVTYEGSTKTMPLAECRRGPSRTQSAGRTASIGSSPEDIENHAAERKQLGRKEATTDFSVAAVTYRVHLQIPSAMSAATVLLDSRPALIVRRTATVITIEVPEGQRNREFRVESAGRPPCILTQSIAKDDTILTPCQQ